MAEKQERNFRSLQEMNLLDDFLFQQMLLQEEGEEFVRILLGTILGKTIRKVRVVPQKNVPSTDRDKHGIRMDAYIEDVSNMEEGVVDAAVSTDIYDIEPNMNYEKGSLPKRVRFYHGLIDTQLLAAAGRMEDIIRAAEDKTYQEQLFAELKI